MIVIYFCHIDINSLVRYQDLMLSLLTPLSEQGLTGNREPPKSSPSLEEILLQVGAELHAGDLILQEATPPEALREQGAPENTRGKRKPVRGAANVTLRRIQRLDS